MRWKKQERPRRGRIAGINQSSLFQNHVFKSNRPIYMNIRHKIQCEVSHLPSPDTNIMNMWGIIFTSPTFDHLVFITVLMLDFCLML